MNALNQQLDSDLNLEAVFTLLPISELALLLSTQHGIEVVKKYSRGEISADSLIELLQENLTE